MANSRGIGRLNINKLIESLGIPETIASNRALKEATGRGMRTLGAEIDKMSEEAQFTSKKTMFSDFFYKIFKGDKAAKTAEDLTMLGLGTVNPFIPLLKSIIDKTITDKEYKKTLNKMGDKYKVPEEFRGTFMESFMKGTGGAALKQSKTYHEDTKKSQQLLDWMDIALSAIPVAGGIGKGFKGIKGLGKVLDTGVGVKAPTKLVGSNMSGVGVKAPNLLGSNVGTQAVGVKAPSSLLINTPAGSTGFKGIQGLLRNIQDIGEAGLQYAGFPKEILGALTKSLGQVGGVTLPSIGRLGMTQKPRFMDLLTSGFEESQFTGMRAPKMQLRNMRRI